LHGQPPPQFASIHQDRALCLSFFCPSFLD
jgi:hypothetical protein